MRRKKTLFALAVVVLIAAAVLPVPVSGEYDPWEGYKKNREAQEEEWARMSGPDYGKLFVIIAIIIALVVSFLALAIAMAKKKEAERLYLERMERREK